MGQVDEYTAALQAARDTLNEIEPDRSQPPPVFLDDMEEMEQQLVTRCSLLQDVRTAIDEKGYDSRAARKELIFA